MREHMACDKWTISPLLLATAEVDRSQGLLYRDMGVKIESGVLAFLLNNGEEKVLVDAGGVEKRKQQRSKYGAKRPKDDGKKK